jgi:mono/diheme cytochrome c family protein
MRPFRINCRIILASTVLLACGQPADAAPSAAKGKEIFHRVGCYECHNYQGQGGVGPRLAPKPLPFEALKSYVRNANGNMPPYRPTVLTDADLEDVYAYLQSIPQGAPADSIPAVKNLKRAAP